VLGKSWPGFLARSSTRVPCGAIMTVIGVNTLLRQGLDSEERAKEVMTWKID